MPAPRIYNVQSLAGGGGGGGSSIDEIRTYAFSFSDGPSPIDAILLELGVKVLTIGIKITTIFDDPAANISVGKAGLADFYMTTTQNNTLETGEYETNPYHIIPSNEYITLSISPGASTQGEGVLIVELDQV